MSRGKNFREKSIVLGAKVPRGRSHCDMSIANSEEHANMNTPKIKLKNGFTQYPDYQDSGISWIGKIPAEWEIAPLRSVAIENQERNYDGRCQKLLSLSYGNIIEKDINTNEGLLPESFNTYQVVRKGNIIFRLTDLQNDKRSLRVGYNDYADPGIITSAYLALVAKESLNDKYAYYLFHSYDLQKVYYGMGGGVRQTLDYFDFKYLPILLPSSETQKKVAEYLDEKTALIDRIIERKKKLIALLREKRTAVINQAVTKGLNPNAELIDSGIEWIGKIPREWAVKKIKHAIRSIASGVWGENLLGNDEDIKCLRVADFDYENLSFSEVQTVRNNHDLREEKILRVGDILVEKSGGGEKTPVGRAILFDSEERMVCANFIDVVRVNRDIVTPEYLTLLLSAMYAKRVNIKYIKQNTGIQNLDLKSYFSEVVCIPDPRTQKFIVDSVFQKMRSFQAAQKKAESSIEALKEFKSSLISNVVTGKVKV